MKEIIEWLMKLEESACLAYGKASALFSEDRDLSGLLKELSEDEKLHYEAMRMASDYFRENDDYPPAVSLDDDAKHSIERPFQDFSRKVGEGRITRKEILDYIVVIEFSELNHVFLYVIDALRDRVNKLTPALSNIEEHKVRIERFIESQPDSSEFLRKLIRLPRLIKKEILVVDDDSATLNLLKAILAHEGTVDVAKDGGEAIKKVGAKTFSAVLTDIDMPVMNGLEFYSKAVEKHPEMKGRFIFFTGSLDAKRASFFRENNLKCLTKPAPINEIRKSVKEVLLRA